MKKYFFIIFLFLKEVGIELLKNFTFPFSRDIAEFWRRWYISLSSWFRDYLYIPLEGSKGGLIMNIRNTFIIFLVSVFWHGANWTFVTWRGLNALYFMPLMITKKNRHNLEIVAMNKLLPSMKEIFQILTTFLLTCFAWVFFRAVLYIKKIFSTTIFSILSYFPYKMISIIGIMIIIEWLNRTKFNGLEIKRYNPWLRRIIYISLIIIVFRYANFGNHEFIYFQF